VTFRVLIEPRAEQDIAHAARWIRDQSKTTSTALRWARGIRSKIAALSTNPQRCPIDPDSDAYGEVVRVLLHGKRHGKYRILFAVRGTTVHVLTVRHAARRSLAEEQTDEASGEEDTGPVR
jgi:plasmid stabilization system protein ParE